MLEERIEGLQFDWLMYRDREMHFEETGSRRKLCEETGSDDNVNGRVPNSRDIWLLRIDRWRW